MLDSERIEKLTEICGGRFALTALLQRRMRELIMNSPRLGETDTQELFETVLNEIEDGTIRLVMPQAKESPAAALPGDK